MHVDRIAEPQRGGPYFAQVWERNFGVMRMGRCRPVVVGVSLRQATELALELNSAWSEDPSQLV